MRQLPKAGEQISQRTYPFACWQPGDAPLVVFAQIVR